METVHDLGALDGPVLIFGGAYGNLEATEALLAQARALGIPPERTICTGDIVAYCAEPAATVAALRGAGCPVVMGNVEEALAAGSGDCGCGYAEGSACDALAAEWYAFAQSRIDAGMRRWMAGLPRAIRFEIGGRRLLAVHGTPSRINRYLLPSEPDRGIADEIAATGSDGVVAGHSGIPFSRVVDGRLWHNAGAIGLPANDGTPRVWYGVLRPTVGGVTVELHALAYDHARAAAAMRAQGLPAGYAEALESGLWPSLDVLPEAERARTGVALDPRPVFWERGGAGATARRGAA